VPEDGGGRVEFDGAAKDHVGGLVL
jgi:hypothetical protein